MIGLGTGSSAGWLGVVPSMERVDVVELEPIVVDVARQSHAVNQDVLNNPKVHVRIGDAREVLLTTSQTYDLIASEPSNPFRADRQPVHTGVLPRRQRSVDRRRAVPAVAPGVWRRRVGGSDRLRDDGLGVSVGRNLADARRRHRAGRGEARAGLRFGAIAARIEEEPCRTALRVAWRSTGLTGFLGSLPGWRPARPRDRVRARRPDQHRRSKHRGVRLRAVARARLPDGDADTRAGPRGRRDPPPDRFRRHRLGGRGHGVGEPDGRRRRLHSDQLAGDPAGSRTPAGADSLLPRGQPRGGPRDVGAAVGIPADQNEIAMVADIQATAGGSGGDDHDRAAPRIPPGEADVMLAELRVAQRDFEGAAGGARAGVRHVPARSVGAAAIHAEGRRPRPDAGRRRTRRSRGG